MRNIACCTLSIGTGVLLLSPLPAQAQIDVTIGGHTKNYIGWVQQDDAAGDAHSVDILRESEIHIRAEAQADNGLTYGFHVEMEADAGDDANTLEESYLYLSSAYGKIIAGSESGAPYLLQVAAPAADPNVDGYNYYIQPVNYTVASAGFAAYLTGTVADGWDYDNSLTGKDEKLTYISPVWGGFQIGLTYTPEVGDANSASGIAGFALDSTDNDLEDAYEAAVLFTEEWEGGALSVGAGYAHLNRTEATVPAALDDFTEWNAGIDLDIGAVGIGAVWTENNNGTVIGDDDRTFVVGADYALTDATIIGASYYDRADDGGQAAGAFDTRRYVGGIRHEAAPGLSLRASLSRISHESPVPGVAAVEATSVLGGIQLDF